MRRVLDFFYQVKNHFVAVNCMSRAAALAYTTLLSIVPLAVLSISLFKAFPIFNRYSGVVENFISEHFLPTSAELFQQNLLTFMDHAQDLSELGLLVLLVTAVFMIFTMEKSINAIWQTPNRKQRLKTFLVYWAVITLFPIFLGLILSFGNYLMALPLLKSATVVSMPKFSYVVQLFFIMLMFCLFYMALPNAKVRLMPALFGGSIAAILIDLARVGFKFYLINFPSYKLIYGALAVIPIFLTWLYLSWFIILLGAVCTYIASQHPMSQG